MAAWTRGAAVARSDGPLCRCPTQGAVLHPCVPTAPSRRRRGGWALGLDYRLTVFPPALNVRLTSAPDEVKEAETADPVPVAVDVAAVDELTVVADAPVRACA